MLSIFFVALVVGIYACVRMKDQYKSGASNKSKEERKAASNGLAAELICVAIVAFLAVGLSSCMDSCSSGNSSNWDSMSEQEKENARYAYETKKWMDENGY